LIYRSNAKEAAPGMRKYSKEWFLLGVLLILIAIMSFLSPDKFLSFDNLQSMAFQLPEFGIIALAMMAVILTGGINLSVTAATSLSGILAAFILAGFNSAGVNIIITIPVAIVVALITAIVCGSINGLVISYIGVSPILVTLATMTLFEGISLKFTKGDAISGFPEKYYYFGNGTILDVPVPLIIFVIVIIIAIILLEHTPWGFKVHMLGYNPKATALSGIDTKKVLLKVYLFSALLGSIAAIIMTSRYNSAKVDYGSSYLFQSLTAVVLGGSDVTGGYGKVMGTVIAVTILQVTSSGLNIFGINRNITDIITGVILILVLASHYINIHYLQYRRLKKSINPKKA
jgi:simple sugar transport system permease protein